MSPCHSERSSIIVILRSGATKNPRQSGLVHPRSLSVMDPSPAIERRDQDDSTKDDSTKEHDKLKADFMYFYPQ